MVWHTGFRWSVGLGRWAGTTVEIHLLLLLAFVATIALTAHAPILGLMIIGVWLASVALHQLAHVIVAYRMGGEVDLVVVGPSGGDYRADLAEEPEPQVLVALAGPAVHLLLVVAAICPLVFQGASEVLSLLHPIAAVSEFTTSAPLGLMAVKMVLWLNWILFLVNLLPAYPFDAAIVLRSLLWPMVGRRTAHLATGRLAQAASVGFLFCGLYLATMVEAQSHVWMIPIFAAFYLFVAAQIDWHAIAELDGDSLDDEWLTLEAEDLEDDLWREDSSHMVLVEQHYDQLRERYERKRKAQEDYEDARVDDILARLHTEGFEHLSQDDQAFLRRASRRYRDRRRDREAPPQ
ncbi:site-2 protease family protein [Aeoliella sp. SH292]|uniref:site-2 protease family protein n=1 Tax=Aeoliella sp. SH292 TaxID=3454464 RepID=UPI003F98F3F0